MAPFTVAVDGNYTPTAHDHTQTAFNASSNLTSAVDHLGGMLNNGHGDVVALTDASETVVAGYAY